MVPDTSGYKRSTEDDFVEQNLPLQQKSIGSTVPMSCWEPCLQGCYRVPTDRCCHFGDNLPSSCPPAVTPALHPAAFLTPSAIVWQFHSRHPPPNLTVISVPTCIQPCECEATCASQRCFKGLAHIASRDCNSH